MRIEDGMSKVPAVTLGFWVIKIIATTLGETGGDAVSMTLNWGYALSSALFIGVFVLAVAAQIAAKSFHPFMYWLVIIATTTAGTTMADFADRSLGIGYPSGSLFLFALLMASLGIWYWRAGSVSVDTVASPRIEMFYWARSAINPRHTLGDWMADSNGLGYERALVFRGTGRGHGGNSYHLTQALFGRFGLTPHSAPPSAICWINLSRTACAFGRFYASAILAAFIVVCIVFCATSRRASGATSGFKGLRDRDAGGVSLKPHRPARACKGALHRRFRFEAWRGGS